jgi:alpha-L-fucosidase
MFSDVGPDIRWVGNEGGTAADTCWATLNPEGYAPGTTIPTNETGDRPGSAWLPAECDVSIRPNWFHRDEDRPKSPQELLDLYYASVGHGATLMLNVPPNQRGLIDERDVKSLREFHRIVNATFKRDLAREAAVTASNTRGDDARFAPKNLIAGNRRMYWSTDDAATNPEVVLSFDHAVTFNVVRLREYLPLGQRIDSFGLDRWENGAWVEFAKGTSIGNCRLVRGAPVTTTKVRLRVAGPVCPALSEVGLFAEPSQARR